MVTSYVFNIAIVLGVIVISGLAVMMLWQRRVAGSLFAMSGVFLFCGLLVERAALRDYLFNSTDGLEGLIYPAYSWFGLPQVAFDTPFILSAVLAFAGLFVTARAAHKLRQDRASYAPIKNGLMDPATYGR